MDIQKIFTYPYDNYALVFTSKKIKRILLEKNPNLIEKKIAILAGSTFHTLRQTLELFLLFRGIKPVFYESGYDQYFEEIMLGDGPLCDFAPDLIYVHTTFRNLKALPDVICKHPLDYYVEREVERYKIFWMKALTEYGCPIIQNNFELPYVRLLGNLDFACELGLSNFIARVNHEMREFANTKRGRFFVNDIFYQAAHFGLEKWHSHELWFQAKYAYSFEAVPFAMANLAAQIAAMFGLAKKCLAVDLDNTLWGGVIGEVGVGGIQLGQGSPQGELFLELQRLLRQLKSKGILLAVVSKNSMTNALAGLNHPDSLLKPSDFAQIMANWDDKAHSIRNLALNLNIGLDAIVFLDDNPAEREQVIGELPEVIVPQPNDNPVNFINCIAQAGYFESIGLSEEDFNRTETYVTENKRNELKKSFSNYADYLTSLEMKLEVDFAKPIYYDRIVQLINKTNQFNLTGLRCQMQDVESWTNDVNRVCLYLRLADKFGDYGLVSFIWGKIIDSTLLIENWVMSCRVFKRDLELAIFSKVLVLCKARYIKQVRGRFVQSAKNEYVADLFACLDFKRLETDCNEKESFWVYDVR